VCACCVLRGTVALLHVEADFAQRVHFCLILLASFVTKTHIVPCSVFILFITSFYDSAWLFLTVRTSRTSFMLAGSSRIPFISFVAREL